MNNPEIASILEPVPAPNRDAGLRLVTSAPIDTDPSIHEILVHALQNAGDAIFVLDAQGHYQYVNAAFERLLGFAQSEILGQSLELILSEQQSTPMSSLWSALWSGNTYRGSLSARTKAGACLGLDATFSPVATDSPRATHFVAVLRVGSNEHKTPMRHQEGPDLTAATHSARRSNPAYKPALPETLPALEAMTLEPEKHGVRFGDRRISLTRVEYRIFSVLADSRGKWVSSGELLARAFGADYAAHDSLVRVHVHKIRRKLGSMAPHVRSAKGRGYLFD